MSLSPVQRRPRTIGVLQLLALLVAAGHLGWFWRHIADDAFISMRYAVNLVSGYGPVYNIGERVEGYTSFLWVLLLAAMSALGIDLPTGSVILGALVVLATVAVVARFPSADAPRGTQPVAALLLACSGSFIVWGKSGMETGLFSLLLLSAAALHAAGQAGPRPAATIGLLSALAAWARPEGVLLFGTLLARRVWQRRLRDAFVSAIPFVVLVGGQLVWRYSYYGSLVPNSAQAKIGFNTAQVARGAHYLADFCATYWPLLVPTLLTIAFRWWGLWLGAFVALYTIYLVAVGGDHFPLHRFFAPLFPLICLLGAAGLIHAARRARHALVLPVLVAAICAGTVLPSAGRHWAVIAHDIDDVRNWAKLGLWLHDHLPAGESVALNPVGAIGFYSGRGIIDMLGINDAHIARAETELGRGPAGHERADGAYVLSRRPAFVFIGVIHPVQSDARRLEPVFLSDYQILMNPSAKALYAAELIRVYDLHFVALRRKSRPDAEGPR